LEENLER